MTKIKHIPGDKEIIFNIYNKKRCSIRRASSDSRKITKKIHGHFCRYCGTKPPRLTIDHIWPVTKGGKNEPENMVPACEKCNRLLDTNYSLKMDILSGRTIILYQIK